MYLNLYLTMLFFLSLLIEVRMGARSLLTEYDYSKKRDVPKISVKQWIAILLVFAPILLAMGYWIGVYTMTVPIQMYLLWFLVARMIPFIPFNNVTNKNALIRKLLSKVSWNWKKGLISILLLVVLLVSMFAWPALVFRQIGFSRAQALRTDLANFQQGDVSMFPEINPSDLRLTTDVISESIAKTKMTTGASMITGTHLGVYDNVLSWITTASGTPVLGSLLLFDSNRIKQLIIVPLNDATGEKAKTLNTMMLYGEGLWFSNSIEIHASDMFPTRTFTRGYLTQNAEGSIVVVTTSYIEIPFGPLVDPKIHVWDPLTGDLLGEYAPNKAPDWAVQKWDESFITTLANDFGFYRVSESNDLDFWINAIYSSDRNAESSEQQGLRYQTWANDTTAVFIFDNRNNDKIMEFLLIANKNGITIYSMDKLGFIGGDEAKAVAVSGLPTLPNDEQYYTPMALLYKIGSNVYYHVPIYQKSQDAYIPVAFALVHAHDRTVTRVSANNENGMEGAVSTAYQEVQSGNINGAKTINGTITEKPQSYDENGNTRQWLTIQGDDGNLTHVLVKYENLATDSEKGKIAYIAINGRISVKVDTNNVVTKVM
jgi:hypothetical protein